MLINGISMSLWIVRLVESADNYKVNFVPKGLCSLEFGMFGCTPKLNRFTN